MNKFKIYLSFLFIFFIYTATNAQVNIEPDRACINCTTPDASAVLDIRTTSIPKGILIPRMPTTDRTTITSPADGLMVYDNTTKSFWYYDAGASAWEEITARSTINFIADADDDTKVQVEETSDDDYIRFDVAGVERWLLHNVALEPRNSGNSVFIGEQAGFNDDLSDNRNVGVGNFTLINNSSGEDNTAVGFSTMLSSQGAKGSGNSAIGAEALFNNLEGNKNAVNGFRAMWSNVIGHSNVAIGENSLFHNQDHSYVVAVGDSALFNMGLIFNPQQEGKIQNTAVGSKALFTTSFGQGNTAMGFESLYSNFDGNSNTATGANSLYNNTNGHENTANGSYALYNNSTGLFNTATGSTALFNNVNSSDNTANGASALWLSTGNANTATGRSALLLNVSGNNNTAIGFSAGLTNSTGSYNLFAGSGADATASNLTNSSAIGANAMVTASNQIRVGNPLVASIGGWAGWTNVSDQRFKKNIKEDVKGLEFINALRPVTYTLDQKAIESFLGKNGPSENATQHTPPDATPDILSGFLAQEVETAAMSLGYDFSGVDKPKNDKDYYGLRYAEFTVPLVKAVQELSNTNETMEDKMKGQEDEINSLKEQIDEMATQLKELDDIKLMIAQLQGCCVEKEASQNADIQIELGTPQNEDIPYLEQNAPNPFYDETIIKYYLPKKFDSATMRFTDWQGRNLKTIQLQDAGHGTISISAKELAAGTYAYTLVVDGQLVDTKKMILTK